MKLEEIVKQYGYNDYYDMNTGKTYKLSEVEKYHDGKLKVPVYENGNFIGFALMCKVEVKKMEKYKMLVLDAKTLEFIEVKVNSHKIGLEEILKAVEGYIEHVTYNKELYDAGIDMWVNEEGKLINLPISTAIFDAKSQNIIEVLNGNICFTAFNGDGYSYSLTDKQIEIIKKVLGDKISLIIGNERMKTRFVIDVRKLDYK